MIIPAGRPAVLLTALLLGALGAWAILTSGGSPPAPPPEEETWREDPTTPPVRTESTVAAEQESGPPAREYVAPAVRGIVRRADDDTPVEGARVLLSGYGGPFNMRAITDGGGFFEFAGAGQGVFGLLISKEGGGSLRVDPVRPARVAPVYRLASGGTLHGRVLSSPEMSPVSSYRVLAARILFDSPAEFDFHRVIHHQLLPESFAADSLEVEDPEGRFRFTELEPGTYVLLVFPRGDRAPVFENGGKGWAYTSEGFRVESGGEAGPVEVVLGLPGAIRVRIVDADTGGPLLGVSFFASLRIDRRHIDFPTTPTRSGADGVYELPAAIDEMGRIESTFITLEKAGYGTVPAAFSGNDDGALVEIVMGKAARIRGRVLGPDGRPAAFANVIVMENGGEQVLAAARTDSAGRYESGPVRAGGDLTVRVFGSTRGNLLGVAPVILRYGEERVLDFGSGKTAAVFGKVHVDGRPVRQASVSLDNADTYIRAHTGDDGTYRIEGLAAGKYEAFVVYTGAGPETIFRTIPFVLKDAEQKRLDFVTDLTISGVALLLEDGKLVPVTEENFEVTARRRGEEGRISTRLLGEGRFVLRLDSPGIYELSFSEGEGYVEREPVRVDLTSEKVATGVRFVVIRDTMNGRITIRVRDAESGEEVKEGGFQYRHRNTSGAGWFEDGSATFEDCGVGTYRIAIESDRYMETTLEVEISTTLRVIDRDVALTPSNAVRIRELAPASPAGDSGIRAGDVVLRYGGERMRHFGELQRAVKRTTTDQTVEVEILRDGEKLTLSIPGGRMGVIVENHRVG